MTAALIILAALIVTGFLLWLHDKHTSKPEEAAAPVATSEECCGMHITCERDSLLASVSETIEYYDDEELDSYRGTAATGYSKEAEEEFRDVLLTLRPDDIAGWARSIQLRGIELPEAVRQELLLIVSEERMKRDGHTV